MVCRLEMLGYDICAAGYNCLQPFWYREPLVCVDMSNVDIGGFGLFALKNIGVGEVLCRYTGELVEHVPEDGGGEWFAGIKNEDGSEWGIDSTSTLNESGRWANHSLDCNAQMLVYNQTYDRLYDKYYIMLVSTKNIQEGEEILLDYGRDYFLDEKTKIVDRIYYTGLPTLIKLL